jgi:hypothetical protein
MCEKNPFPTRLELVVCYCAWGIAAVAIFLALPQFMLWAVGK